eukprot:86915-Chlamydomonas_euryale.AAC.5
MQAGMTAACTAASSPAARRQVEQPGDAALAVLLADRGVALQVVCTRRHLARPAVLIQQRRRGRRAVVVPLARRDERVGVVVVGKLLLLARKHLGASYFVREAANADAAGAVAIAAAGRGVVRRRCITVHRLAAVRVRLPRLRQRARGGAGACGLQRATLVGKLFASGSAVHVPLQPCASA